MTNDNSKPQLRCIFCKKLVAHGPTCIGCRYKSLPPIKGKKTKHKRIVKFGKSFWIPLDEPPLEERLKNWTKK
jgi:hypothetical protein